MSQTYSIYEAKTKFSEVIRKAKAKNEIVITERGVPVVLMIPFKNKNSTWDSFLNEHEQAGTLTKAKRKISQARKLARKSPILKSQENILAEIRKDRY